MASTIKALRHANSNIDVKKVVKKTKISHCKVQVSAASKHQLILIANIATLICDSLLLVSLTKRQNN